MQRKGLFLAVFSIMIGLHLICGTAFAQQLGWKPMERDAYSGYIKKDISRRALAPVPENWDWRESGAVTISKDQMQCGSCWAFAATGALESKIIIASGKEYDLSEQMLVSCYGPPNAYGCCGGMLDAVRFYETVCPREESCYPYGDGDFYRIHETCPPTADIAKNYTCPPVCWNIGEFYTMDASLPDEIKRSVQTDGPGSVAFYVYDDFFTYWANPAGAAPWTDGVYFAQTDELAGGHAVLLIGWDDATQSYLCKNSWGPYGGPFGDGTFKIRFDQIDEFANFTIIEGLCGNYDISLKHRKVRVENAVELTEGRDAAIECVSKVATTFPEHIEGGYIYTLVEFSSGESYVDYEPIPDSDYCQWNKKTGELNHKILINWQGSSWVDVEYWIMDIQGVESQHDQIRVYARGRRR